MNEFTFCSVKYPDAARFRAELTRITLFWRSPWWIAMPVERSKIMDDKYIWRLYCVKRVFPCKFAWKIRGLRNTISEIIWISFFEVFPSYIIHGHWKEENRQRAFTERRPKNVEYIPHHRPLHYPRESLCNTRASIPFAPSDSRDSLYARARH